MRTYHVAIDWNNDGDFIGAGEVLDPAVISVAWQLGLTHPDHAMAAPAWADILLRDSARNYSPDHADGALYGLLNPHKSVRITSEMSGVVTTHFVGWTESITPRQDGTTMIRCAGLGALLQRADVFLPPLTHTTVDAAVAAILADVAYPPALNGYWLMGQSELGSSTRLPDVSTYADLETGVSVFPYIGDRWHDGDVSAWDALATVTQAEGGLCFVDREGRVVLWNRHHLPKVTEPSLSLTTRDADYSISYEGGVMVNRAVVICYPREVGVSAVVLWTLQAPFKLEAGQTRMLRAEFSSSDSNAKVGALSLENLIPGSDYLVNTAADGTGHDRTASITVMMEQGASGALLTFSNPTGGTVYVLSGAQVRGVPITVWDEAAIFAEDVTSQTQYGRRERVFDRPLMASLDEADRMARHVIFEGSAPRVCVDRVVVRALNAMLREAICSLTIGDVVRLIDDASGVDELVHIVGEAHTLTRGGSEHSVIWTVRPAPPVMYWQLGVSGAGELSTKTRITY